VIRRFRYGGRLLTAKQQACTPGVDSLTLEQAAAASQERRLSQLLPEWKLAELPAHAYFSMGRPTRLSGREFVDFIASGQKKTS
jgi:hypothetical protein